MFKINKMNENIRDYIIKQLKEKHKAKTTSRAKRFLFPFEFS